MRKEPLARLKPDSLKWGQGMPRAELKRKEEIDERALDDRPS